MSTINYDLKKIKAFAFDVDGVLSSNVINVSPEGILMRTANIKDGYALQYALRKGVPIAIITGGNSEAVRIRFAELGVTDIYLCSSVKIHDYCDFRDKHGLKDEEILYMGDDIPDLEVLQRCGLPCCPRDASHEVKACCTYISHVYGGQGCARDVIEQVMRTQGTWMDAEALRW